ncbi:MAG: hypothetical protein U9N52_04950 [Campylobacterota bacterium]|nr:hypothetical protein [Campylobacterota bacterium]
MKTSLYIFTSLMFIQLNAASDLKWVDEQIDAIKPSRTGLDSSYVNTLKDPVKIDVVEKVDTKSPSGPTTSNVKSSSTSTRKLHLRPLTLETIINEKAYISGKWYTLNEKVRGQKIMLIDKDYVVLEYKKKKTRLFVNSKNDKIKITTR